MFKSRPLLIPLGISVLLFSYSVLASHPQKRTTSTFEEFLKGEFKGVSVTSEGRLIPAPAFEEVLDTREAFIYSAVFNRAGALFLGTGNNGKVFRVDPAGSGEEFVKLDEASVYALAIDSQNRLYAGTSPDGNVYRINSEGEAQVFFDPGEKYIWALAFDTSNNLFVATGPRGKIYKVDSSGNGEEFFDSEDIHIVSLEWDLNGNLLTGSSPGGFLFRIDGQGKAFALLDSPLEEIKAVAIDRYGTIFAAALSGGPKPETETATTTTTTTMGTNTAESTVKVVGTNDGKKLEVYRIDKENLVETIYSSDEELVFDLIVRDDGTALLGTGNRGRIMAVSPQRFATLLVESDEEQVTKLLEQGGNVYAATSNLGKVYKLGAEPPSTAVFTSDVIDAGMVARWGAIRWTITSPGATDGIQLFTRSGNTKTPDRTWADWDGPYEDPSGSQVTSVPARFLQWKAEFSPEARGQGLLSQANALDSVSVSFLQRNVAPELTQLTVHEAGVAFAKFPPVNSSGGVPPGGPDGAHATSLPRRIRELETPRVQVPLRKTYIPGSRSFSWKARDANGDNLLFSIYYKGENEETWRLLKEGLTDQHYTLDGASFADGVYLARVVVSDKLSNPSDRALEDRMESKAFVISNSRPVVNWADVQAQGTEVSLSFSVESSTSTLYQVEISLDAGEWQLLLPDDGVTDETREQFATTLNGLERGSHVVRVRVVDEVGNLGTSQRSFETQ